MYGRFNLDGDGPLYAQITRALAHDIESGRLEPGDKLPSEQDFTVLFQASRMTVNRALRRLADDGMVTRKRRGGTVVAARVRDHAVLDIHDIQDDITASGATYHYELIFTAVGPANSRIAAMLSISAGDPVAHIRCRHFGDGEPILLEDRHINLATVLNLDVAIFDKTPPNTWLIGHVPWSRASLSVTAISADHQISQDLSVPMGAPCLRVDRTTWQIDQAVTCVALIYPGDKHRLNAQFSPSPVL